MAYTKEQLLVMETELCDKFWTWRLQNFPEFATSVGEHQHDHKLTKMSVEAFQGRYDQSKHILQEVDELLRDFQENNHVTENLELLQFELQTFVDGFQYQSYMCPISNLEGPQLTFSSLLTSMPQNNVTHFANILSRLRLFPAQLVEMIDLMREGIQRYITPHASSVYAVSSQFKKMMTSSITECPLFQAFVEKPNSITDEEWDAIIEQCTIILKQEVYPSLNKMLEFLDTEYLEHARDSISVETLPNGKLYYRACLQYHTCTDLSPTEIHNIGLKEVERIKLKTLQMLKEIGFQGTYTDFIKNTREEDAKNYSAKDNVVEKYSLIYDEILEKLPEMFSILPRNKCHFKTIECTNYPAGLYREGTFVINKHHVKGTMPIAYALALHEMIPGHHLQHEIALHNNSIPHFRKLRESGNYYSIPARFPLNTAFGEGWALYAEHLGEELGMYRTTYQFSRRLFNELFRAVRLVVDTGMHAFSWSKEQAVQYMVDVMGMALDFASSEVNRYITWPGQACSYKIGELKIKELRDRVSTSLGEDFDLKEFHDLVLRKGEVPLQVIEQHVNSYIDVKMSMLQQVEEQ